VKDARTSSSAYNAFDAKAFLVLSIFNGNSNTVSTKSGFNPSENLLQALPDKVNELNRLAR